VDDIVQTVWLDLVGAIQGIRSPARLSSWLITATRRETMKTMRRRRAEVHSGDTLDQVAEAASSEGDEARELSVREHVLLRLITLLPPRQQDIVKLKLVEPPLSNGEMADMLGIPVGSVGPTLLRAIAALRRLSLEPAGKFGAIASSLLA
jgi:RNA polymerase sigma factor (sigma-70 family)